MSVLHTRFGPTEGASTRRDGVLHGLSEDLFANKTREPTAGDYGFKVTRRADGGLEVVSVSIVEDDFGNQHERRRKVADVYDDRIVMRQTGAECDHFLNEIKSLLSYVFGIDALALDTCRLEFGFRRFYESPYGLHYSLNYAYAGYIPCTQHPNPVLTFHHNMSDLPLIGNGWAVDVQPLHIDHTLRGVADEATMKHYMPVITETDGKIFENEQQPQRVVRTRSVSLLQHGVKGPSSISE